MSSITSYEQQHEWIKGGIQARVNANDWNNLVLDAADLITLESLIARAPFPTAAPAGTVAVNIPTVMSAPLGVVK